ncbi:MAG: sugar phosphate isomerase/epimerase family protein, partial [Vicinamibacterales bacterium]
IGAAAIQARPLTAGARDRALPHPPGGRLGLELYSLRNELKKDLAGTLKLVREWGFQEVELAGFPSMSASDTARALRAADLHAVSQFVDYERLRDDFAGVVRDARTLGLETVICGWIPHENTLTQKDVDSAIASFNSWGAAAAREKLRLGYHIHGYEFVAGPGGTLLDTLFKATDPRLVDYEMDVFWVVRGGGDPVALLDKYGARIRIVHLKDLARGTPTGVTTGEAPDEASVALGTGIIDWTAVMKAAIKARVKWYLIEDEHPAAVRQIPQSVEYLRRLSLA